jgi:hypothetical protein
MEPMVSTSPLPAHGEVFVDAHREERTLRLSWHQDAGVVVLSLWRVNVCVGSFRLPAEEVPAFIEALRSGLGEGYGATGLADREAG